MQEMSIGVDPPIGVGWLPEIETNEWGWPGGYFCWLEILIISIVISVLFPSLSGCKHNVSFTHPLTQTSSLIDLARTQTTITQIHLSFFYAVAALLPACFSRLTI